MIGGLLPLLDVRDDMELIFHISRNRLISCRLCINTTRRDRAKFRLNVPIVLWVLDNGDGGGGGCDDGSTSDWQLHLTYHVRSSVNAYCSSSGANG